MMRIRMFGFLAALTACLFFVTPARADSLSGDFIIKNGVASASGGNVNFTLNGNGTIAANVTSFDGGIIGFGFDSAAFGLPESNFSTAISNTNGSSDMYGFHLSGFSCDSSVGCGTHVSWTIGNAGEFSSAFQALGGGHASYDFFLYTIANGNQWGANAVAAPVPEPETYAMLLAGLGLFAWLGRRRNRKAA